MATGQCRKVMLFYSRVSQGTQHRAPQGVQLVGKFHCRNLNFHALNHPYGGPNPATPQRYEPELSETKTPPQAAQNRAIPGYTGIKIKHFFLRPSSVRISSLFLNFRRRGAQNGQPITSDRTSVSPSPGGEGWGEGGRCTDFLPGRKLAKAGTQVAIAGISRPAKFSRCQQVPDIVSYCHIWSAMREKYFHCPA
jgi:hypothetical protein